MRIKPQEPLNQSYGAAFGNMCQAAQNFWPLHIMPPNGNNIIYVDLLIQDIRVAIRILTLAAAMQRHTQARIVAIVGPDPYWADMIWSYYDLDRLTQLARAYGADEILHLDDLVRSSIAGHRSFTVLGDTVDIPPEAGCSRERFEEIAEATTLRALRIPIVTHDVQDSTEHADLQRRCEHYARVWDALMQPSVTALVTSHIDYHQWGYGVDAAMRHAVPVLHVQSTGSFKAYALHPESTNVKLTARMNWTLQIAEFFEKHVWSARNILWRPAEVVAFRAKANYGRPSWWRGGGSISELGFRSAEDRASVRRHATETLNLVPDKPVIAVFNHAVSDAVHSNLEIFENLAEWFSRTVEFAVDHPEVNWLFLDHPAQEFYDGTGMFELLAEQHEDFPHMVFRPSMELSKNELWSMVDLAVTVRGSVSNEFPAYGVPAIQAGWSEWSHCGLSYRADTQDEYWRLIADGIGTLLAGESLITREQIQRARLWLWFYRSGTDVASGLVPHWESSQAERLYQAVSVRLTQVESDADAALLAVHRMMNHREPFLTRVDLTAPKQALADSLGVVDQHIDQMPDTDPVEGDGDPGFGLLTIFDELPSTRPLPADFHSGEDPSLVIYDGLIRGVGVLGRGARPGILLGLKIEQQQAQLQIEVRLKLDAASHAWWRRKFSDADENDSQLPRHIVVRAFGVPVGGGTIGGGEHEMHVVCTVPGDLVGTGGLLMLEFADARILGFNGESSSAPMFGIRVDRVHCSILEKAAPPAISLPQSREESRVVQGSVAPRDRPCFLRFRILEKPELDLRLSQSRLTKPLGRALRKSGVIFRDVRRKARPTSVINQPSWLVPAYDALGHQVPVTARILDGDVVEVAFPARAANDVIFFELQGDERALTAAGYAPSVAFLPVDDQQIRSEP